MVTRKHCPAENCHSEATGRGICFSSSSNRRRLVSLVLLLVCMDAPPLAAAEELGRLFLTPQQRQDLDRRRATNRAEEEAPQIREGPLTVEGHLQRSGGKTTTWINGVPQYDGAAGRDAARVTVVPNAGEPGVSLKVGQTYERTSGEIRGILNGSELIVGKPPKNTRPATARNPAAEPPAPRR